MTRTQVGIIGAGPAGLLLSHLLQLGGVESVVLERRRREHVERRVRAGVLEQGTADLLRAVGLGDRLEREGLRHRGIFLAFEGSRHHLDFVDLVGRGIVVYGQQEVVKDLIEARLAAAGEIRFESEAVQLTGLAAGEPTIGYRELGANAELSCDLVVACDGGHGLGRSAMPAGSFQAFHREYPHAWLGILAATPPAANELIYAYHENGFALHSMRSPEVSRLYLQVDAGEQLSAWPEDRIWSELRLRLGEADLEQGTVLESSITPMRAMVLEPMQHGRLFLAGDAAHIVPPTGAKGMNLAVSDVTVLARAIIEWYGSGSQEQLDGYSAECLRRVWRASRFSAFMTSLLHRDRAGDPYAHRLRLAELAHTVASRAARASIAEEYTGAATGPEDVWG